MDSKSEESPMPEYVEGRESWAAEYGSFLDNLPNITLRLAFMSRVVSGLGGRGSKLRALDLGAAYGFYASVLKEQGHDVYCIEWAEDAYRELARRLGRDKSFRQSVSEVFPLGDESLDLVYAFDLIEHISDQTIGRMLHECERVLRPGGVLIISTPNGGPAARLFFRILGGLVPRINRLLYGPDHVNLFTAPRLRRLLEQSMPRCTLRQLVYANFMFGGFPIASVVDRVLLRHFGASANLVAIMEKGR